MQISLLHEYFQLFSEFGRAIVRILARRSRAKIPMARPNEPDMPPKRTKNVRLGFYRTKRPWSERTHPPYMGLFQ